MAEVQDLSTTDASNTARFPEHMAPSAVNNGARALEGMIARWYADTNGSIVSAGTDTITLAASRTITAYAQGQVFIFEAGGTNTGAVTLNVDSVGAKDVKKNFNVALAAGDIVAGQIVAVAYEATADNFQMISPTPDSTAAASETVAGKVELATDAETVTGTDTVRAVTPANVTAKMAAPGAIGGTTPAAITGTTITATGTMTPQGLVDASGASAGQFKFPATANPSTNANTLDDYEEVDWTPVVVANTMGNLSVSYTIQIGKAIKVGKTVTAWFTLAFTPTHTTAAGNMTITGLPYTSLNVSNALHAGALVGYKGITKAGYMDFGVIVASNTTVVQLIAAGTGIANAALDITDIPTGTASFLRGSVTYSADS